MFRPCLTRSPPSAFSLLVGQPPCGRTARFCNLFKLGAVNELRFPGEAGRIREACSVGCRLFCWAPLPPAGAGLDKTQRSDPSPGGGQGGWRTPHQGFRAAANRPNSPGGRDTLKALDILSPNTWGVHLPPGEAGGDSQPLVVVGGVTPPGERSRLCSSRAGPYPGPHPAARAPLLPAFPHHRGQSFMLISSRRP